MMKLTVIGNPIEHSISPQIHQQFASETDVALTYNKTLAPLDGFANTIQRLVQEGYAGASVTAPFKLEAFALCDVVLPAAKRAGVVNTLLFEAGKIMGTNTDGAGLLRDIQDNIPYALKNKTIVVLGAGGAARGILPHLLDVNPQQIIIANRTESNAQALADRYQDSECVSAMGLNGLSDVTCDVLIDATSFGFDPATLSDRFTVATDGLVYDLKYDPKSPTRLQQWAQQRGIHRAYDGFGMLVEQAADAFTLWTGVSPVLDAE